MEVHVIILTMSYWIHVELGKNIYKILSKNKLTFNFIKHDIQGVFLKCAEILPTRLFDNLQD
jgi:hypothetical protein